MDANEIETLEEAAELDVERLKRMLEARAEATSEFQRVKTEMLSRATAS